MLGQEIDFSRKESWEKEFGTHIDQDRWLVNYRSSLQISCNVNIWENGINMYLQWYYTPLVSQKMCGNGGRCWRYGVKNANFTHIWWYCNAIQTFWSKIKKIR